MMEKIKIRIYIVEDNVLDLKITSRAVENIGFTVSGNSLSGEDALEQIAVIRPDIVLMDIFLRGEMDGIDAADRILEKFDIPVIFLTAHSEMDLLLRASQSHSFGYVLKPFDVNALHAMIRMALSRHRLAQRLKESELFSRTIVNNIQAGVILYDAETRIIKVNFAACRILGRSGEELYGKSAGEWPDRFYYSDGSPMPEKEYPVNRVYAENKAVRDIIAGFYRPPDQIMHWILIHAVPISAHDGSLKQVLTTFTDISPRKQAEDALYREREFLNAVLENIEDGIVACNARGKLTLFNQATRRYHGLPEELLPPEKWAQYYELYLSDGRTPMKKEDIPLFRAFQGEHIRNSEMIIAPRQGKKRTMLASGCPIFDENGRKFGAVVSMHDITEEKTAREALRDSEERFRTTFDQSPIGAAIVGLDFHFERVNREFCNITGYSGEELISLSFPEITHPDDLQGDLEHAAKLRAGEIDTYQIDKRYIRKDGKPVWVRLSARIIRNPEGDPLYYLPLIEDIDKRKKTEEALQLSEHRFRLMAEAIEDVFWMSRPGITEMLYVSPAYEKIWGRSRQSLYRSPQSFLDMVHPDDRERVMEGVAKHAESFWNYEYRIVRQDGTVRWIRDRGFPIRNNAGELNFMAGISSDISDLKEKEAELRRHREELEKQVELRTAELRIANLHLQEERDAAQKYLDIAGVIMLVLDMQGNIRLINKKGCEILETCEEDIIGLSWPAEFIPKEMQEKIRQILKKTIRDNATSHHYNENHIVSRKGKKKLIAWHNITLRDAENRITGILSSGEDITERRQTEALLEKRQAELERSNRELDDFAYIVSHDLREPLRGIRNYAKFLLQDYSGKLDTDGENKLETLVFLSERLDGLIESLLHYSRLGRQNPAMREIDLNEPLKGVLDVLKLSIEEAKADIRVPDSLPTMICDPVQVHEVFFNLISNALKYNDKSEKWVEITHKKDEKGRTVFCIRDNGIGIREKHLDVIFRIFKRLHGRDKYGGGYGFGLTIVQKIIENHGGKIWVESEFGQGTCFCFTFYNG